MERVVDKGLPVFYKLIIFNVRQYKLYKNHLQSVTVDDKKITCVGPKYNRAMCV
jgi:hypothetical protein